MNNKENYPTWLVPIEIAQELKAIGFDEPTMFYLIDRSGQILLNPDNGGVDLCGAYSLELKEILLSNYNDESFNVRGTTSIPTFEQALNWFRKRGVVGSIIFKHSMAGSVIFEDSTDLFKGEVTFWNDVLEVWRKITTLGGDDYITACNDMLMVMIDCYRKIN